jgi:hypothetical protein
MAFIEWNQEVETFATKAAAESLAPAPGRRELMESAISTQPLLPRWTGISNASESLYSRHRIAPAYGCGADMLGNQSLLIRGVASASMDAWNFILASAFSA